MRHPTIGPTGLAGLVLTVLLLPGCSSSRSPAVSDDALVRVEGTSLDEVYQDPGFENSAFQRLTVEKCSVQFRDNWLRDQNRERGPSEQVTVEDMQRITTRLADTCHQIFAERLEGIVLAEDTPERETRVLTVKPSVVDLDILAPDIHASGRQTQLATNAVRMGLQLEVIDSETGTTVARIVDHRRSEETGQPRPTSSVGNMADAERILRHWAALVRAQLETSAD
jgi:hypothetical protein